MALISLIHEKFVEEDIVIFLPSLLSCFEVLVNWLIKLVTGSKRTARLPESSTLSNIFFLLKGTSLSKSYWECSTSDGALDPPLDVFPSGLQSWSASIPVFPLLFFKQTSVISWLLIPVIIFCLKFLRVDLKVSVKALKLDCWYYWCFCGTILSWIAPLPASADPDSLIIVILNKRNY